MSSISEATIYIYIVSNHLQFDCVQTELSGRELVGNTIFHMTDLTPPTTLRKPKER